MREMLTNPAWWSVIVTFVAAFIAAMITLVLGKRQNKLQEQQLKLQERQNELQEQQNQLQKQQNAIQCYEIYKNTQQIFASINFFARFLLPDILHYLKHDYRPNSGAYLLEQISDQIAAYRNELEDRTTDIEIHHSHSPIFEYEDLLAASETIVDALKKIISKEGIVQPETTIQQSLQEDENYYVESIACYISDEFVES